MILHVPCVYHYSKLIISNLFYLLPFSFKLIEQANEHRREMREERQYRASEIDRISSNLDSKLKRHDVNHSGSVYVLKQRYEKEKVSNCCTCRLVSYMPYIFSTVYTI